MTFVNTTAIAYGQKLAAASWLWWYAIAVVFTNVMRLRVWVSENSVNKALPKLGAIIIRSISHPKPELPFLLT